MGIILVLLQIVQYRTRIRDLQIEVYGFLIGAIFLAFGAWIGFRFYQQKPAKEKLNTALLTLSKREKEVLELVAEGYSNQEIADKLFVSLNTTKTHISKIYSKLGVSRRTQAVQKARSIVANTNAER